MATSYDTARSQYQNFRFCYDNGHEQFIAKAEQCFRFWNSQQWEPAVEAQLRREGRPALTLNIIEALVRSMKGIQRALRNDVRFVPVREATADTAQVKDAIWLDAQNRNALDFLESDVYEKGLIMSRAYYDVRMDYSESMQGDIKITPRRSQDVILDPSVDDYDPDTWPQVMTRRWVSKNDVIARYGRAAAEQLVLNPLPAWYDYEDRFMAQQMGQMPYYRYGYADGFLDMDNVRGHLLLERQYREVKRKNVFVDVETGDWKEIPENWDSERIGQVLQSVPGLNTVKKDVPTLRWTVTCEQETLHDEDSPYNHLTIVPFFPSFVDGATRGAVESLIDPQQLFNKVTSNELHILSTTANSGYKLKTGSLKNMTVHELGQVGAKSGVVFELENTEDLEKLQPNQLPQGHDRLSFKANQIAQQLSGVSNSGRGFARDDASGDKVLQDQAGQDINFAGWLANLHRSKQLLARNVLDLAQQQYTTTRTLLINRGSAMVPNMQSVTLNQPMPEGDMLNDVTRGKYSTVLVPAPSRTTMSEEDFRILLELRKDIGIAIPDAMLVELSPASNKSAILNAMQGSDSNDRQRAAEEAAAQQQQVEQQKSLAQAQKEEAAARLNQARAEKAVVEAASDPDASYERVEMARIGADRDATNQKHQIEVRKLDDQREFHNKEIAVRLTEIDHKTREGEKDRASQQQLVAAKQQQAVKRREMKPSK